MRRLALIIFFIAGVSFASSSEWNKQQIKQEFSTKKTLKLTVDEEELSIPSGTKLKLVEKSELEVIKVYLHRYQILDKCPSSKIETDLELVPTIQPDQKKMSVGVNLVKGCKLEVFINMKEYQTLGFLK